jgi:hypothetical protein
MANKLIENEWTTFANQNDKHAGIEKLKSGSSSHN